MLAVQLAIAAVCLSPPVAGPLVAGYAPVGEYAGHWGVDYGVPVVTVVAAPASGVVTVAGSVAGTRTVTLEPPPGPPVSVAYPWRLLVTTSERVISGQAGC